MWIKRSLQLLSGLLFAVCLSASPQEMCARGEPEPFFREGKTLLKAQEFRRLSSHEALEKVQLHSGARLEVKHWGCESYAITISIDPEGKALPASDFRETLRLAARWLRELKPMVANPVFDLERDAKALDRAAESDAKHTYGDEIPVPGDGTDFLQTKISLENPPPGSPFTLILTLSKGPL